MQDMRLLERLAESDQYSGYSSSINTEHLSRSVLNHLALLLNTRRGSSPLSPDYGLPDFNDMVTRFPDAIVELKREIKKTVELFEPRLTRVRVSHVQDDDNPLSLRYEISAQLVMPGSKSSIWFETTLDDSGKVKVMG